MRWNLVDTFLTLKRHRYSRARKRLEGTEDFFEDHMPGYPMVPQTLMVEMIAQTGGVLYGVDIDFKKEVIFAKITEAEFPEVIQPPCDLDIEAEILEENESAVRLRGVVKANGRIAARAEIMLAAMESLDADATAAGKKIVFNDNFLNHYEIREVAKRSDRDE